MPADWVIGDIQGCDASLRALLAVLAPGPQDRISFVGDIVNRGPASLAALRRVQGLCEAGRARTVLGNHDLNLLAVAAGFRKPAPGDTLTDILAAPDRDALLDWLASQPLLLRDDGPQGPDFIVHAGLHPDWDAETAEACASEVSAELASRQRSDFLQRMYGNQPETWTRAAGDGEARQRFTVNVCTRMRFVGRDDHALLLKAKGGAEAPPEGALPWFAAPHARPSKSRVFFGHWSTLEHVAWPQYGVYGLDTGCVWKGHLSAMDRLSGQLVSVPAAPGDGQAP